MDTGEAVRDGRCALEEGGEAVGLLGDDVGLEGVDLGGEAGFPRREEGVQFLSIDPGGCAKADERFVALILPEVVAKGGRDDAELACAAEEAAEAGLEAEGAEVVGSDAALGEEPDASAGAGEKLGRVVEGRADGEGVGSVDREGPYAAEEAKSAHVEMFHHAVAVDGDGLIQEDGEVEVPPGGVVGEEKEAGGVGI